MARANSDGYAITNNLKYCQDLDFDESYSKSTNNGNDNSTRKSRQPLARCKSDCGTSSVSPPLPSRPNVRHCHGSSILPMPHMDSLIVTIEKRDRVSDRTHRADLSCSSYYSIDAGKHGFLTHRATDSTDSLVLGSFPGCDAPPADLSPRCTLPYQERKRLVQSEEKERRWNKIARRMQSRQRQQRRFKSIVGGRREKEIKVGEGGGPEVDKTSPVPAQQEIAADNLLDNATEASHHQIYATDRVAENIASDADGTHGNHTPLPTNTTARWCGKLFAKVTKKARRIRSGKGGKTSMMGRSSICGTAKKRMPEQHA